MSGNDVWSLTHKYRRVYKVPIKLIAHDSTNTDLKSVNAEGREINIAFGPVNALTLWPPDKVKVTKGADNIGVYHRTERSLRKWCKICGGHLFTDHPLWKLTDVYAAIIPSLLFKPALHVNYQETVLPMKDGLPKQKDVPEEMGGSGVLPKD